MAPAVKTWMDGCAVVTPWSKCAPHVCLRVVPERGPLAKVGASVWPLATFELVPACWRPGCAALYSFAQTILPHDLTDTILPNKWEDPWDLVGSRVQHTIFLLTVSYSPHASILAVPYSPHAILTLSYSPHAYLHLPLYLYVFCLTIVHYGVIVFLIPKNLTYVLF